jgi:DNA-directed RNA polymerase subunit alpha
MPTQEDKFVSYIESRIQDNGELYARFHLGTFVEGQALTIANALRRTLLSEIPGFVVTSVDIDNASHEFSTLLGIHESVLNILLNLKRMAVMSRNEKLFNYFSVLPPCHADKLTPYQFNAHINLSGPGTVTAANIKFPPELTPVFPDHHIALLSSVSNLKMDLNIAFLDPLHPIKRSTEDLKKPTNRFFLDTIPKPVRQVNYGIHESTVQNTTEYISLEIWTDGSIHPKQALDCALEKLTTLFYEFTRLEKLTTNSLV